MPKTKKKTLSATQLPSGSWRCRVYDNVLKKQVSFTAPTPEEATLKAQQYKLNHEANTAADATRTLSECIDAYIESKTNVLSPTTISNYINIKSSQLSPEFLNKRMLSLKGIDIQNEINRLAGTEYKPGKLYSAKSVYNAHGLISATVKTFLPELKYNVTLPRQEKRKKDLPTPEIVIEAFRGHELELVVLLALWQGFRVSEIRGFKKSDFKDGVLSVNRVIVTVKSKPVEKTIAKTEKSKRSLQVPPVIMEMVNNVQGEYITKLTDVRINVKFKKVMSKAGFPDITFHDLRHLNASVMLMLGVPDKYAMERGGWSTTSTLKNVYQETFSEERKKIDTQIDDYFAHLYTQTSTLSDTPKPQPPRKPRKFRLKRI